jgi:nucleoside-diphosphate-sugar epimerase
LVTGAGGYIGSVLVDLLLESGRKVIGVDRYFFGEDLLGDTLKNPNFHLVKKDIRDLTAKDFTGVNAVCDLAALSNDPSGELDGHLTYAINHAGRVHVANTAKEAGVKRYVLASSCSVYGHGENEVLTEESHPRPVSVYAKANLKAEHDILPMADDNFCVTVLRQATVFGLSKRMRFDLVINIMTLFAIQKSKIIITGGGTQWRPLVHVRDTARAFMMSLDAPQKKVSGQTFNVGSSDNNYQILNLAYVVRESIPFPIEIEVAPDDPDKRNYNVSFEKIKTTLGFEAKHSPTDGVKEIYEAIKRGRVDTGPKSITVQWYKKILEAKQLVDNLTLNGRLL